MGGPYGETRFDRPGVSYLGKVETPKRQANRVDLSRLKELMRISEIVAKARRRFVRSQKER